MFGALEEPLSQCLTDTFGMVSQIFSEPFQRDTVEKLKCDFESENPANLELFSLNYYPSLQKFADHRGTDMVPERN